MENAQFLLDGTLILLLGATLFHALRLERALGVLKRDRAVLEALVAGFNDSTRAAEAGIEKLRGATDGAGRAIARQIEQAQRLRDDLGFLTERGDRLAERLEGGVRSARMFTDQHAAAPFTQPASPSPAPTVPPALSMREPALPQQDFSAGGFEPAVGPRLRSEAERDLLRALRAAR